MQKYYLIPFLTLLPSLQAHAENVNFTEQIAEGGIAIIVIIALSILALAVVFERLVNFRIENIAPSNTLKEAKLLWASGNFTQLQLMLAKEKNTLAKIILFMVNHRTQNYSIISSSVSDIASIDLRRHQQKAYALAIVATVAPIVGLLGTVIGMIEAFHIIATADAMGNPALLAGGISKALINTAAGLSVALPSLGMHHFFKNRAVFYSLTLESNVNQLLSDWFIPQTQSNQSAA